MPTFEQFEGVRTQLRPYFEMADDSKLEIERYIEAGEVFVARDGRDIVGHVQAIWRHAECEIKSISVAENWRRRGIGTGLIRFVVACSTTRGCRRIVVGTATADTENLLFYHRLGFRSERIERDIFTADRGYPDLEVSGIAVRDRVWLSLQIGAGADL